VGLLESNFNTPLYKVLQEIKYWNKIGSQGLINMPIQFARLSTKQDQLRIFRENVMLIVRDYNNIMNMINDREKSLFKEHMAELDKFINRGISFYSWNGNAESFAIQCRNNCETTLNKIKIFQERNGQISDEMEKI
jgi:dynein heavy chain